MRNHEIAKVFEEIADMSEFLGDNPFRVRAYREAARILAGLETPVEALAQQGVEALEAIPGIGRVIALKILTYLEMGKLKKHEELKQKVPAGVLQVMQVPGIGGKTAKRLYDQLGVDSLARLREVLESGAVLSLPGFGKQRRARLLHNLAVVETEGSQPRESGKILM
ncbi:MAG: helix-hairpin-helix domain-containing protein [candidate division WOR-3 bacterium]